MNAPTQAIIIHPIVRGDQTSVLRAPESALAEAVGLSEAIGLAVAHAEAPTIARPRPATLLGVGKIEEIAARVREIADATCVVIIDAELTPVQQRNLERDIGAKVIDRTGLILEIFGARAKTREGRLQVELAHLTYQKSRLVRSWTHLERQRGGAGFLGGPGETQIEADRRALAQKILRLERQLDDVKKRRSLQGAQRRKTETPTIALVGYTNAGKSTLFNRLTGAEEFAQNMLFATLDPKLRALSLPSGVEAVLSDTVGFVSQLPTQLVAAFRATLEEAVSADVIVHVRDIAHDDTAAQNADVLGVLEELGVDADSDRHFIEVLNKSDALSAEDFSTLRLACAGSQHDYRTGRSRRAQCLLSASTGYGVDNLLSLLDVAVSEAAQTYSVVLEAGEGAQRAWLHAHGVVQSVHEYETGESQYIVQLTSRDADKFEKRFGPLSVAGGDDRAATPSREAIPHG